MAEKASTNKSLLQELKERFPIEHVEPYGLCLIVPQKDFSKQNEQLLKHQGFKIYYQGHDGQLCAFIVLEKNQERTCAVPSTVGGTSTASPRKGADSSPLAAVAKDKPRLWTEEDNATLKQLRVQGLSYKDIARRLGRTEAAVEHKIRALESGCENLDIREVDQGEEKPRRPDDPAVAVAATRPTQHALVDVDTVKELLSAASALYPSHKKACLVILNEVQEAIKYEVGQDTR